MVCQNCGENFLNYFKPHFYIVCCNFWCRDFWFFKRVSFWKEETEKVYFDTKSRMQNKNRKISSLCMTVYVGNYINYLPWGCHQGKNYPQQFKISWRNLWHFKGDCNLAGFCEGFLISFCGCFPLGNHPWGNHLQYKHYPSIRKINTIATEQMIK